jgi:hypothetical protein
MTGPPLPVIIFLAVAACGAVVVVALTVRSDRSRGSLSGGPVDVGWVGQPGRCTTCVPVDAPLDLDGPARLLIAQQAMSRVGGTDVVVAGDVVIGWTPVAPLTGWFFGWAPQQLAVQVREAEGGTVQFLCCSRARFGIALSDWGRSRQMASKLAAVVGGLTHAPK